MGASSINTGSGSLGLADIEKGELVLLQIDTALRHPVSVSSVAIEAESMVWDRAMRRKEGERGDQRDRERERERERETERESERIDATSPVPYSNSPHQETTTRALLKTLSCDFFAAVPLQLEGDALLIDSPEKLQNLSDALQLMRDVLSVCLRSSILFCAPSIVHSPPICSPSPLSSISFSPFF